MPEARTATEPFLPHTLPAAEVCAHLGSSPKGLSAAEAAKRLAEHGPNALTGSQGISPWKIFLDQLKNVLILILLAAALLSGFLGHGVEAIAIGVIVLFAVLLGFFQEFRAERALEALREMTAPTATVLRDGEEHEIPARDLVPGDVVLLAAGDRIPGDGRLLETVGLKVQEAALTGESEATEKNPAPLAGAELALGDRKNMVYAGTAATYGRGRAVLVATGMGTEIGKIAGMLATVETSRTPLQHNLDKLGQTLARAAFVLVAVIVVLGLVRGQPFLEMLVFGVALAVAVVPEALPAVVTISLALGVQRLIKRKALMRRLAAVETLGSTTFICSDKTGTLTRDEMTVRQVWADGELLDVAGIGYEPHGKFFRAGEEVEPSAAVGRLLSAAALASDARVVRDEEEGRYRIKGDPTEGALVVAAAKLGLVKAELDARFPRVDEIPFSSESRRMTTFHEVGGDVVAHAKGAPEVVLESCERIAIAAGEAQLGAELRERILAAAHTMAEGALRVLAVASRPQATRENAERGLTFLGLVGMIDPPRPEAAAAIRTCEEAGIRVAMITGDHPATARAVATELGLLTPSQRVVTGVELERMDDAELAREVETVGVFARVSPAHKLRLVTALQARGHVVAMTGDGANDAPALKKADIGVAMGITGTDVAKEAAAMTLTDDNFASIVAAVEEGRGIFGNIKKYLMFLLSSNVGEIGLMAGSALFGLPLPLSAVQILYVNLATDGLPALALAVDPPEADLMRRRPRDQHRGIFTRPVVTLMLIAGLWSTIVNLGLFTWALQSGRGVDEAMTMTFVCLVLIQFVNAYNCRSDRLSAFNRPLANKWLNRAVLWELALLVVVVHVPFFHEPLGTFSLSLEDWLIAAVLAATITPVLELAKALERRGWFGEMG